MALQEHQAAVMRGLTAVLVSHARSVHGVELEKDPLAEVAPAFVVRRNRRRDRQLMTWGTGPTSADGLPISMQRLHGR